MKYSRALTHRILSHSLKEMLPKIRSANRTPDVVTARDVVIGYLAWRLHWPNVDIGAYLGKSHTCVPEMVNRFRNSDEKRRMIMDDLLTKIEESEYMWVSDYRDIRHQKTVVNFFNRNKELL